MVMNGRINELSTIAFNSNSPHKSTTNEFGQDRDRLGASLDYPSYAKAFHIARAQDLRQHSSLLELRFLDLAKKMLRCDSWYFIYYHILDDQKILLCSFHMDDVAYEWFSYIETSDMLKTWQVFTNDLLKRFHNSKYNVPGGRLDKLRQGTIVEEFQIQFKAYSNRVTRIPD